MSGENAIDIPFRVTMILALSREMKFYPVLMTKERNLFIVSTLSVKYRLSIKG